MKVVLSLLLLSLAGCVSFEPKPIEPLQNVAAFEARSLEDESLQRFIESNSSSSSAETSPSVWDLERLTLAAFYFHPELDVARAQWAVAEAGRISAGERPGLGAAITPGRNATTTTPSARLLATTVDLTLETAGKRGYRVAEAEQLAESARLNIASVAWQVRSGVRSSLLDLYGAIESQALLRQQLAVQDENLEILEGQYRAGAISAFELTQGRLAADSTRLALRDADRLEAEARVQLADAVGITVGALDSASLAYESFGQLPSGIGAGDARQQALLNRADILGALADYAASQSRLQLEVARQYPDINLGPGYEYDQGDDKWSLGLGVSLPANRNRGAIADATARREQAAARFNALQANVLGQIDGALAAYHAASAKQADAGAMLAVLTEQETVAQQMLDAGAISKSELAAQQLQLSAASLARLDALLQAQQAVGQLESAIQGPLELPTVVWENAPQAAASTGDSVRP